MPLVNCPECGAGVSGDALACPRCGFPRPGGPVAMPPRRGVSTGWIIVGFMAMGALAVGLLGWGVYRFAQYAENGPRAPYERVDYLDTVPSTPAEDFEGFPDYADSAQREVAADEGRVLPPDSGTYDLGVVEAAPELLNRDEVATALQRNYPPLLRDAGVEGRVMLRYRVTRDGMVDPGSVGVEEASHDAFSEAAVRVVKRMRFRPARYKGSPVPVWVVQPITFQTSM